MPEFFESIFLYRSRQNFEQDSDPCVQRHIFCLKQETQTVESQGKEKADDGKRKKNMGIF